MVDHRIEYHTAAVIMSSHGTSGDSNKKFQRDQKRRLKVDAKRQRRQQKRQLP
jgi:hypothetical protein